MSARRVAVLGGGVAALAAVWDLVRHDQNLSVVVYQMGWRLGGKCASGRNAANAQRIEEHGLHVLFGFYENAFAMYREVYDAYQPPEGGPLKDWTDAFVGLNTFTLAEDVEGDWQPWTLSMPEQPGSPGEKAKNGGIYHYSPEHLAKQYIDGVVRFVNAEMPTHNLIERLLRDVVDGAILEAGRQIEEGHSGALKIALDILNELLPSTWARIEKFVDHNAKLRRVWVMMELGLTIVKGLVEISRENQTREAVDRYNLIDWLDHCSPIPGGLSVLTRDSAPLRMLYEVAFAYKDGDHQRPTVAAYTAVLAAARMLFDYSGHVAYQMQGGTGDILAAPLYRVLQSPTYRDRVRFEFFHEVRALRLSHDEREVQSVEMRVQATPKEEGYDPLVTVKGMECWPDAPIYCHLKEGDELRQGNELPSAPGYNLESPWSAWQGVGCKTLQRGTDFDDLILAIPVGALEHIAADLCANPRWLQAMASASTVATQSMQFWLNESGETLGAGPWMQSNALIHGTYQPPQSNWADWSDLIGPCEDWPADATPQSMMLICGTYSTPDPAPPPGTSPGYNADQDLKVREQALKFLQSKIKVIMPDALDANGFRFNLLSDVRNGEGEARFEAQYWRANVAPWERYVLSFPDTIAKRLPAGRSPFPGMYVCGDWTANGLDVGAVEAAVTSGRLAARALLEAEHTIYGVPVQGD